MPAFSIPRELLLRLCLRKARRSVRLQQNI